MYNLTINLINAGNKKDSLNDEIIQIIIVINSIKK